MAEQGSVVNANDAVTTVLRGRRTIDLYEPEPVGTQVLRDAIDVARWAPNHRLTQPWRFYLIGPVTRAAIIDLAAELDTAAKGERAGAARRARLSAIPAFFVLTSRRSENPLVDREDYAACCCAAQNLMLYLWQRGVGVKWTTGAVTRHQRFYDLLGVEPNAELVVGFFWYGIPKVIPKQERRSPSEIVTELA